MRCLPLLVVLLIFTVSTSCNSKEDAGTDDAGTNDSATSDSATSDSAASDGAEAPPVELTPDLCDDPSKMALLVESLGGGGSPSYGEINLEQIQRMVAAPTQGPFYMVNLIRFREQAVYPDGRETDLTGSEANALYAPVEFLAAIGARAVFAGQVIGTTIGQDGAWDEVAIVEYPCPLALFAMSAHPEFQARSVHKEAGVEASIVMVTHLQPLEDLEPTDTPFPPTASDPAFELVQVIRHHEQAQYPTGSNEPARTGKEAMDLYASSVQEAQLRLGISPAARLDVQGVFIGDGSAWDAVWIDHVPSRAALNALASEPEAVAAEHHRQAALADAYGLMVDAMLSELPDAPGGENSLPPVTADGTGTLCQTNDECPGNGVDTCINPDVKGGFCTREGCGAGECQPPYVCCHDCSEAVASMLPFVGSACFPDDQVGQLTAAPVSCTCD
jgi:hypothetical protein